MAAEAEHCEGDEGVGGFESEGDAGDQLFHGTQTRLAFLTAKLKACRSLT